MLPFLVGQLTVTKPDGTVVKIGGGKSSDSSDDEHDGSTTQTSQASPPAKHRRTTGSDGLDGTAVPIVAIVFVFLWLIIKALMAPFTQRKGRAREAASGNEGLTEEEQAILLKLQRTIGQMEQRVESLETILIDEHRTKEKYGTKL